MRWLPAWRRASQAAPPGQGQAQDVGQIVPGVGHQGGGLGEPPGAELDRHEGQVDAQPDQIAPVARIGRAVMMAVMTVRMVVAVMIVRVPHVLFLGA